MKEISGFGIRVPRLPSTIMPAGLSSTWAARTSASILTNLASWKRSISHHSSLARADELVPDQVFFIAVQLNASGRNMASSMTPANLTTAEAALVLKNFFLNTVPYTHSRLYGIAHFQFLHRSNLTIFYSVITFFQTNLKSIINVSGRFCIV